MIVPCIINYLTCVVSATRSTSYNMQCPVQQRYIKLQQTTKNLTHPYMDTTIRTLRPETNKRGRPNTPRHPSSAGRSQKDLDAPIPKELVPGASVRNPTRDKVMRKEADIRKACSDFRDPSGNS